jgi:hypothetical protein
MNQSMYNNSVAQPDKQQSVLLPDLVGIKATYSGGMNTPGGGQGSNQASSVKAQVVKVKMASSSAIEHSPQKPQR